MIKEAAPFIVCNYESGVGPVRTVHDGVVDVVQKDLSIPDVRVRMVIVVEAKLRPEKSGIDVGNSGKRSRCAVVIEVTDGREHRQIFQSPQCEERDVTEIVFTGKALCGE